MEKENSKTKLKELVKGSLAQLIKSLDGQEMTGEVFKAFIEEHGKDYLKLNYLYFEARTSIIYSENPVLNLDQLSTIQYIALSEPSKERIFEALSQLSQRIASGNNIIYASMLSVEHLIFYALGIDLKITEADKIAQYYKGDIIEFDEWTLRPSKAETQKLKDTLEELVKQINNKVTEVKAFELATLKVLQVQNVKGIFIKQYFRRTLKDLKKLSKEDIQNAKPLISYSKATPTPDQIQGAKIMLFSGGRFDLFKNQIKYF